MAKKDYLARYLLILKKVSSNTYTSFEELVDFISKEQQYWTYVDESINLSFSRRTLQRDIAEIKSLYGIEIEYSRRNKGYFIDNNFAEKNHFSQLLNQFEVYTILLSESSSLLENLVFQRNPETNLEHLNSILKAIKERRQISISYLPHYYQQAKSHLIEPYGLRENKKLWYLIGFDQVSGKFKTFGIDRIELVQLLNHKFQRQDFSQDLHFKHTYGITIVDDNDDPVDIKLTFSNLQGRYIVSNPLHSSQSIKYEDNTKIEITLHVVPNEELEMELLSFGESLLEIEPEWLKKRVRLRHLNAAQNLK